VEFNYIRACLPAFPPPPPPPRFLISPGRPSVCAVSSSSLILSLFPFLRRSTSYTSFYFPRSLSPTVTSCYPLLIACRRIARGLDFRIKIFKFRRPVQRKLLLPTQLLFVISSVIRAPNYARPSPPNRPNALFTARADIQMPGLSRASSSEVETSLIFLFFFAFS